MDYTYFRNFGLFLRFVINIWGSRFGNMVYAGGGEMLILVFSFGFLVFSVGKDLAVW